MSKPLSEDEMKILAQFVRGMIQGTVSFGFSSLGVLDLYKRAQAHKQSMIDILMSDPQVCVDLAKACKKGAARLPSAVLIVLEQIIVEAKELQAEERSRPAPVGSEDVDV